MKKKYTEEEKKKAAEAKAEKKKNMKIMYEETMDSIMHDVSSMTEYLKFAATFSTYSHNNQILILSQFPTATLVKTFIGWKKLGRKVTGHGIMIYTPAPQRYKKKVDKTDANGNPVLDANGNPVKEDIEKQWMGYDIAYVYDVSQTSGDPLPGLQCMDEDPLYETDEDLADALNQIDGVTLPAGLTPEDMFRWAVTKRGESADSGAIEAAAYTLAAYCQIDTSHFDTARIFSWAKSLEKKELTQELSAMQRTVKNCVAEMEGTLANAV